MKRQFVVLGVFIAMARIVKIVVGYKVKKGTIASDLMLLVMRKQIWQLLKFTTQVHAWHHSFQKKQQSEGYGEKRIHWLQK